MHRDIKPANILMNSIDDIKLADFGLSKQFKIPFRKDSSRSGSFPYMAPELLSGRNDHSVLVDLWAVGCIMYHMMTGSFLCYDADEKLKDKSDKLLSQQIRIFGTQTFVDSDILVKNEHKMFIQNEDIQPRGLLVGTGSCLIKDRSE